MPFEGNPIVDGKGIRCNPKSKWMSDKWHGEDFSLNLHLDQSGLGGERGKRERPNEKEREKRGILEREALPSL